MPECGTPWAPGNTGDASEMSAARERESPIPAMITVYALECRDGRWYVGRTDRPLPADRVLEHFQGRGSEWTRRWPPVSLDRCWSDAGAFDEDLRTKEYMARYGIDRVRGGSYCQLELSPEVRRVLQAELDTAARRCFRCHQPGHFVQECPLPAVPKQGADGRTAPPDEDQWIVVDRPCTARRLFCDRCGRSGHAESSCYARSDVNGVPLDRRSACIRCGSRGHSACHRRGGSLWSHLTKWWGLAWRSSVSFGGHERQ